MTAPTEEGTVELPNTKFRKKPVVIDATQWFKNGDHPLDYSKDHDGLEGGELRVFTGAERKANGWEGDIVRYFRHPEVPGDKACEHCGQTMHVHGWIDTLEGGHIVCPGDWVITGIKGEHYPCKPDIFAATYEPAGASRSPVVGAVGGEPTEEQKDAARYRWLRQRNWFDSPLCVLRDPKKVLTRGASLGADCPSRDRLDAAIDAAMGGIGVSPTGSPEGEVSNG